MKMNRSTARNCWSPHLLAACFFFLLLTPALAAQANDEVTPEVQQLYAQAKAAQQRGDGAAAIEK